MHDATLLDLLGDDFLRVALLPARVPTLAAVAAYEAEALRVCERQARTIARECTTVAPKRCS